MEVSPLVWTVTLVITIGLLIFDVFVIGRRPHEPSTREVTVSLAFFVEPGRAVRDRRVGVRGRTVRR